jgi:hypothetical protein
VQFKPEEATNENYKSELSDAWLRNETCQLQLKCAVHIKNIAADASDKEILQLVRRTKFSIPGRSILSQDASAIVLLAWSLQLGLPLKLSLLEDSSTQVLPFEATAGA